MRANSFAGQILAVLSRRAAVFQPRPDEPSTFPGRVHAATKVRRRSHSSLRARNSRTLTPKAHTHGAVRDYAAKRGTTDRLGTQGSDALTRTGTHEHGRGGEPGIQRQPGPRAQPARSARRSELHRQRVKLARAVMTIIALVITAAVPFHAPDSHNAPTSSPPGTAAPGTTSPGTEAPGTTSAPSPGATAGCQQAAAAIEKYYQAAAESTWSGRYTADFRAYEMIAAAANSGASGSVQSALHVLTEDLSDLAYAAQAEDSSVYNAEAARTSADIQTLETDCGPS